jgi:CRISPR-associated protein Cas1
MQDLHILPKLRDSLSYVYAEQAIIQRNQHAVELVDKTGTTHIPIASLSVFLLGPGTSISHEAVKLLTENGCSILWVGEESTRFYAYGTGETRRGYRTLRQASLISDETAHKQVVLKMYRKRFDDILDPDLTIAQIRGMEGVRMRNAYAHFSRRMGVAWNGRNYERGNWATADPINRALSAANALLNGICHAAIVSGGYSTCLGFIHTGKQLSFVYDIADLYKTEITIPVAFEVVANGTEQVESRTRQLCRTRFKETRLLQRILPDIDELLQIGDEDEADDMVFDSDGALPGPLWDDEMDEEGM